MRTPTWNPHRSRCWLFPCSVFIATCSTHIQMWNQASKLACIDGPSHMVFCAIEYSDSPTSSWCNMCYVHGAWNTKRLYKFQGRMEWPVLSKRKSQENKINTNLCVPLPATYQKKEKKTSGGAMFSWSMSKISWLAQFICMCISHELYHSSPLGWWISPLRCMSEQPWWNRGSSTVSKGRC